MPETIQNNLEVFNMITKEQVKKIAELAKIEISESDIDKYAKELSSVLEYVERIKKIPTSKVKLSSNIDDFKGEVLREDVAGGSLPEDKVFLNAKNGRSTDDYFSTSKIL